MNKSASSKFGSVLRRTPSIQEYNKEKAPIVEISKDEKIQENTVKEMVLKIEEKLNPPIEIFDDLANNKDINPIVKPTLQKLLFQSRYKSS
jgi:hypothetical protein